MDELDHLRRHVAELERAEEALKKDQELFRGLAEETSDWLWEMDRNGVYTYASPKVTELLGYAPEEIIGKTPFDLMPQDQASRSARIFSDIFEARKSFDQLEKTQLHKNGHVIVLESSGVPIFDDGKEIRGYRGVDRDITERKQAERFLQKAHDELEIRMHERTVELKRRNEQLQNEIAERKRAKENLEKTLVELERSNRELEEFAYIASHDLQEPLRKIQAFGDRLESKYAEALDERGRDYLRRMQNAAGRMRALIDDLLTYSRITTRAQPFAMVDLTRVAYEVISDLEISLRNTGGTVKVSELPTIEADPTQMRQLLQNLIGNGLKFHKRDETPVVQVRAELLKECCRILVQDRGIGFDEQYRERIFSIFQRLHGRFEYEGTGIGLAVCRKIVQRHRGTITADSVPGKGTTFIVTLPIRQPTGGRKHD